MGATAWLMNLDFAGGNGGVDAPTDTSQSLTRVMHSEARWSKRWRETGGVRWTKLQSPSAQHSV